MGLKGFESITQELNAFEKRIIVPLMVRGLSKYIGKDNAINNAAICNKVNSHKDVKYDYKLTNVKCRKVIQYIRLKNLIEGLCSCHKGYYVAANLGEIKECIDSLTQRLNIQKKVRDGLTNNMLKKYNNVDIFKRYNDIA
tara:strand:+ start:7021 stop:7440 length:420 start_codon:yes stop_codon:yes gene_type:complete